jgi:type IV secretory pathway TrbF-like protein
MDKEMTKQSHEVEPSRKLEFSNAADATGFWFAAAVLCAALAAGVIVYRSANSDIVTASNDVPQTGQAHQAPPAAAQH